MFSNRSMRTKYSQHLKSAEERGLDSSLSYHEFFKLKVSDCYYCDIPSMFLELYSEYMGLKTPYMTIDRKNSSLPYTEKNTVAACAMCNRVKSNIFDHIEFKEIAQKYIKPKWLKHKDDVEDDYDNWSY